MTETRSVWFERRGVAVVRREELPEPAPGQVLVHALRTGISAGTERIVLLGEVPPEARHAMSLPAMRGSFDLPISYGYCVIGRVEEPGEDAQMVFSLHPHQERFWARREGLRPLPQTVRAERLTLSPNLETAVNVVWDAGVALGDVVVVVGLGVVGLLVAWLSVRSGARVIAIDIDEGRRALALKLGVAAVDAALSSPHLGEADILVEASGSPDALGALVENAGPGAQIIVASWYGARPSKLLLGGTFHRHRVTVRSSQVGALPSLKLARWDLKRRWKLVCELLGESVLDALVAEATPLSDAPAVYAELATGRRWDPPQRVFDPAR